MIKRIIFDLDDTIFISSPYFNGRIKKGLKGTKYQNEDDIIEKINHAFPLYEKKYDIYNVQKYVSFFNETYKKDITIDLVNKINLEIAKINKLKPNAKKILKYLSKKYEIIALTNYFYDVQKARLIKTGILKYFKNIYAGDKNLCKPNIESFKLSCGNFKYEECVIIGDSARNDYLVPIKLGMKAILFDELNKYDNSFNKINNLIELKKYL